MNQQNFDTTYVGKIDVDKKVHFSDPKISDETDVFKNVGISISILNNTTLIISFDKQSTLFSDFKDIPLVGIVQ